MKRLKLRGRVVEKFGTIGEFCAKTGFTPSTASNVLNGKTTPTWKNIIKWCYALGISPEEAHIFFTEEPLISKEAR